MTHLNGIRSSPQGGVLAKNRNEESKSPALPPAYKLAH